jgi:hypothetical protein
MGVPAPGQKQYIRPPLPAALDCRASRFATTKAGEVTKVNFGDLHHIPDSFRR